MPRTRFAPSNTGYFHAGSARTALFAYLWANYNGGIFSLRIEDTDAERSKTEYLIDIMEGMQWLGIKTDVGPSLEDVKNGIFEPKYFQSKMGNLYKRHIDCLLEANKAYKDDTGAVIFKFPKKNYVLFDKILGKIPFSFEDQKDFVIQRSDGTPTFHLANVVSDATEGMTLLIKGNDHIPNFPKHAALFEALGYSLPNYAHLPLILDDKRQKLSKRRTDQFVLIKDFRENGFLPSAIVHMLSTLGWSNKYAGPKDQPILMPELIKSFRLEHCLKANPIYDQKKAVYINTMHMKTLPLRTVGDEFLKYGDKYCPDLTKKIDSSGGTFSKFVSLYREKAKNIKESFENCKFLVDHSGDFPEMKYNKKMIDNLINDLSSVEWTPEAILISLNKIKDKHNYQFGDIATHIRHAISKQKVTPPIEKTMFVLGQNAVLSRMATLKKAIS